MEGTIAAFDAAEGLGWIDLTDGRRVRFEVTACRGFVPAVGARVRVGGVEEVLGKLRATTIEPSLGQLDLEEWVWPEVTQEFSVERRWMNGEQREVRLRRVLFDQDELHEKQPDWPPFSAFSELVMTPASPKDWAGVQWPAPPPFFAAWHDGICRTAVGALRLTPGEDRAGATSRIGGSTARLARSWPECSGGHGPMTLLVVVEPEALAPLVGSSMRLTIHGCPTCLNKTHHQWLGKKPAAASVEWSPASAGQFVTVAADAPLPEVRLHAESIHSIPPSWVFQPRADVKGHLPVQGVPAMLLEVKLLRDGSVSDAANAYVAADRVYDNHYAAPQSDGLFLGGFSVFRFALCAVCKHPLRHFLHLNDYFTDNAFADLFQGSNELTLLSCDRTPACGGPESGLLVLDP